MPSAGRRRADGSGSSSRGQRLRLRCGRRHRPRDQRRGARRGSSARSGRATAVERVSASRSRASLRWRSAARRAAQRAGPRLRFELIAAGVLAPRGRGEAAREGARDRELHDVAAELLLDAVEPCVRRLEAGGDQVDEHAEIVDACVALREEIGLEPARPCGSAEFIRPRTSAMCRATGKTSARMPSCTASLMRVGSVASISAVVAASAATWSRARCRRRIEIGRRRGGPCGAIERAVESVVHGGDVSLGAGRNGLGVRLLETRDTLVTVAAWTWPSSTTTSRQS